MSTNNLSSSASGRFSLSAAALHILAMALREKRPEAGVDRLLVDIRVLLYLNRSVIGRGDTGMCSAFIIYRRADSRNAAAINFL